MEATTYTPSTRWAVASAAALVLAASLPAGVATPELSTRKLPGATADHVDDWRAMAAERRAVRIRASRDQVRPGRLAKPAVRSRPIHKRPGIRTEPVRRPTVTARKSPKKVHHTTARSRRKATTPVHTVGTGSVATAIRFALAAVGDRYQIRAAGPHAYDCSGLVMAAFARIGIALPHSSAEIIGYGKPVSQAQLRPGDLVFPHPGHVVIYLGGGRIVEAANERAGVRVAPLWGFWTARRLL